jgi:Phage integrase SAM-like domain
LPPLRCTRSRSAGWIANAGSGRDSVRENTRRESRRLLATFALRYFDRDVRLRIIDRAGVQGFVDWLTSQPGRNGRLCDRSVANALTPLRAVLDAAVAAGVLEQNPADGVV